MRLRGTSDAYESHFGENQHWHSMMPASIATKLRSNAITVEEANARTRGRIKAQLLEWYVRSVPDQDATPRHGIDWLGHILHRVQDSYSPSHTKRVGGAPRFTTTSSSRQCGEITGKPTPGCRSLGRRRTSRPKPTGPSCRFWCASPGWSSRSGSRTSRRTALRRRSFAECSIACGATTRRTCSNPILPGTSVSFLSLETCFRFELVAVDAPADPRRGASAYFGERAPPPNNNKPRGPSSEDPRWAIGAARLSSGSRSSSRSSSRSRSRSRRLNNSKTPGRAPVDSKTLGRADMFRGVGCCCYPYSATRIFSFVRCARPTTVRRVTRRAVLLFDLLRGCLRRRTPSTVDGTSTARRRRGAGPTRQGRPASNAGRWPIFFFSCGRGVLGGEENN